MCESTTQAPEAILSVEDACEAGMTVADLNSTEYLTLFSDTIVALNDNLNGTQDTSSTDTGSFDPTIPAQDIDTHCEVRLVAKNTTQHARCCVHASAGLVQVLTCVRTIGAHQKHNTLAGCLGRSSALGQEVPTCLYAYCT